MTSPFLEEVLRLPNSRASSELRYALTLLLADKNGGSAVVSCCTKYGKLKNKRVLIFTCRCHKGENCIVAKIGNYLAYSWSWNTIARCFVCRHCQIVIVADFFPGGIVVQTTV